MKYRGFNQATESCDCRGRIPGLSKHAHPAPATQGQISHCRAFRVANLVISELIRAGLKSLAQQIKFLQLRSRSTAQAKSGRASIRRQRLGS